MLDFASFDCLTAQFHVLQEKMRQKVVNLIAEIKQDKNGQNMQGFEQA